MFPRTWEIIAENFKSSKLRPVARYQSVTIKRSSAVIAYLILVFCFDINSLTMLKSSLKHVSSILR